MQGADPKHSIHGVEGPLLARVCLSYVDQVVLESPIDVDTWGRQPVQRYEGGALG